MCTPLPKVGPTRVGLDVLDDFPPGWTGAGGRPYSTDGLIDKSALARRGEAAVRARLDELDLDGLLAVCAPTEFEILYSARGKPEALRLRSLLRGFDCLPCNDEEFERALEIQALALNAGFHRALSLADLLIAATAERH